MFYPKTLRSLCPLWFFFRAILISWSCEEEESVSFVKAPGSSTLVDSKVLDQSDLQLSVKRGHEAFYTYGCWHCHTLGDEEAPGFRDGLVTGPDLADVGDRLNAGELLQSILEPNAVIAEPKDEHVENGLSKMPAFDDPAAMADIRDMVRFLEHCKLPEKNENNILEVTDGNFQQLMNKNKDLVLLDFWAEWCFACFEANPALEAVAPQFEDRLKVFKIEVDENPVLVDKYVPDLMFPCFVIMRDGKVLDRKYGLDKTMDAKDFFKQWIAKFDSKAARDHGTSPSDE